MAGTGVKIVAKNQKAYHEYFIEEKFEAGIELSGTEVKSIRLGHAEPQGGLVPDQGWAALHPANAHRAL